MTSVYALLVGVAIGFYLRGKLKKVLPTKENIVDKITSKLFGNGKKGGRK